MWEEREDYAWVHWFQDGQEALIDRVEKAAKRFRYSYNRIDNARILVFGERAGLDVIEVRDVRRRRHARRDQGPCRAGGNSHLASGAGDCPLTFLA
jgi:hypothetical protein